MGILDMFKKKENKETATNNTPVPPQQNVEVTPVAPPQPPVVNQESQGNLGSPVPAIAPDVPAVPEVQPITNGQNPQPVMTPELNVVTSVNTPAPMTPMMPQEPATSNIQVGISTTNMLENNPFMESQTAPAFNQVPQAPVEAQVPNFDNIFNATPADLIQQPAPTPIDNSNMVAPTPVVHEPFPAQTINESGTIAPVIDPSLKTEESSSIDFERQNATDIIPAVEDTAALIDNPKPIVEQQIALNVNPEEIFVGGSTKDDEITNIVGNTIMEEEQEMPTMAPKQFNENIVPSSAEPITINATPVQPTTINPEPVIPIMNNMNVESSPLNEASPIVPPVIQPNSEMVPDLPAFANGTPATPVIQPTPEMPILNQNIPEPVNPVISEAPNAFESQGISNVAPEMSAVDNAISNDAMPSLASGSELVTPTLPQNPVVAETPNIANVIVEEVPPTSEAVAVPENTIEPVNHVAPVVPNVAQETPVAEAVPEMPAVTPIAESTPEAPAVAPVASEVPVVDNAIPNDAMPSLAPGSELVTPTLPQNPVVAEAPSVANVNVEVVAVPENTPEQVIPVAKAAPTTDEGTNTNETVAPPVLPVSVENTTEVKEPPVAEAVPEMPAVTPVAESVPATPTVAPVVPEVPAVDNATLNDTTPSLAPGSELVTPTLPQNPVVTETPSVANVNVEVPTTPEVVAASENTPEPASPVPSPTPIVTEPAVAQNAAPEMSAVNPVAETAPEMPTVAPVTPEMPTATSVSPTNEPVEPAIQPVSNPQQANEGIAVLPALEPIKPVVDAIPTITEATPAPQIETPIEVLPIDDEIQQIVEVDNNDSIVNQSATPVEVTVNNTTPTSFQQSTSFETNQFNQPIDPSLVPLSTDEEPHKTKFCDNCGMMITDDSTLCPSCGAAII